MIIWYSKPYLLTTSASTIARTRGPLPAQNTDLFQGLYIKILWSFSFNLVKNCLIFEKFFYEEQTDTPILTYSMEQSPSWEANRFSASQAIPRILWNPKVHCRIYKCLDIPLYIITFVKPRSHPITTCIIISSLYFWYAAWWL